MNLRAGAWAVVLFGLLGCTQPQVRSQAGEDIDSKEAELKTVGDVTAVDNADPVPVSGVGLVTGLSGTGAPAPIGGYRTMMETELKRRGVENIKEILNSKDASLVLVTALVPPGARKGDPVDVEVSLPEGSKTTSLRGGYLQECVLKTYDTTRNVVPTTTAANRLLEGEKVVTAKGALLVGFGDGDAAATLKRGHVWGGGTCHKDRGFYLVLNPDQQQARVAMRVAERINETFQGAFPDTTNAVAEAKTKTVVCLRVPQQYKLNLPRFLRVVRLIPLLENPPPGSPYRKHLEEDLLDPAKTITAALRLEALGGDSVAVLKRALKSEHVLVRFSAAEALTYLGSAAGGEELARLVKEQPLLRSYCLTALASLDETICHFKLQELMAEPSAETRYGAFRALRALRPTDESVSGELLNDSFWLHRVAPQGPSLVHISSSRRAEVVLFGEEVYLEPPFSFQAGPEFTVTASAEDDKCTLRRFSAQDGVSPPRQCSLKLSDVLHRLAEMGGSYPEVVDLLRRADGCHCLSCRLAVDALPEAASVYDLARAGQLSKEKKAAGDDDELLRADEEVVKARSEFGATPNLFDGGRKKPEREERVAARHD